ncbi:MAG: protealysin inhibitor emfourin [Actinomycetota bacterium]
MQLKLVRSGGLAGLDMVTILDSADLTVDQQALVANLLTARASTPDERQGRGADQFRYQLEIHQGDSTVLHRWAEPDVPATVRPLLAVLVRKAKPAH